MPTISRTVGSKVGTVNGSISGTTLTVNSVVSGSIAVGQKLTASGIAPNTYVTGQLTGSGGTGTYTVSVAQTFAAATISAARDFATLADWRASVPNDLVADGNAREALVYNDGEVVVTTGTGAYLDFPASMVTSAACFIRIAAAPGERLYGGRLAYDPTMGPAIRSTKFDMVVLRVNVDFVTIENMQLKGTDEYTNVMRLYGANNRAVGCVIDGYRGTYSHLELGGGATLLNCFVINQFPAHGNGVGVGNSGKVINCTIVRPSNNTVGAAGIAYDYGDANNVARNNLILGFTNAISLTNGAQMSASSGNNVTSGTSVIAGDVQNVAYADQVIQPSTAVANPDWRIKEGSAAINAAAVITGLDSNQYDIFNNYRQTPDSGAFEILEPATALLIVGPTSGIIGQPSDEFTVMLNGSYGSALTVNLSDASGGGTFNPSPVTIPQGSTSATFRYTAGSGGAKSISVTNSSGGSIANPAARTFTATVLAPSGAVTSQPAPDGQTLVVSFSTANTPTSGTAVLNPASSNPNGAVQTTGTVAFTSGAGTATFSNIPPGNYAAPVITITNSGGSATVTGTQALTVLAITGEPEAPGSTPDTTAPTITAAAVASASPGVVVLTSSEPLDTNSVPAASAFTVTGHTVQSVAIAGSAINLTVTPVFANGEAPRTVSYAIPGTNPVRDLASPANSMAAFSNVNIANNVAAPVSTVTGVTINPTTATVSGGATQQFTGSVQGTNSPSQALTWTRSPAVGTISGAGLFTAPAATNVAQTITVTATSQQDPNFAASATVTVPAASPAGTNFTRSVARTIKVKVAPQAFEGGPFWDMTNKRKPVGTIDKDETIDVSFDLSEVLADIADTVKKIDFDLAGLTSVGGYFTGSIATVFVSNAVALAGGKNPTITCRMTTNSTPARIEDWTVELKIEEQ